MQSCNPYYSEIITKIKTYTQLSVYCQIQLMAELELQLPTKITELEAKMLFVMRKAKAQCSLEEVDFLMRVETELQQIEEDSESQRIIKCVPVRNLKNG